LLATLVGPGAVSAVGQSRFWSARLVGAGITDWAHPPLPLGLRTRLLAECAVAVGIIVAWRFVLEPVRLLLPRPHAFMGVPDLAAACAVDACLLLPCAVAWMAPWKSRALHLTTAFLTPFLLMAWSPAAASIGAWSWVLPGAALTALLMVPARAWLRAGWTRRWTPRAGALVRAGRTPETQLWRDFWLGPFTSNLWLTAMMAAVALANVGAGVLGRDRSFVTGMAAGMSFALLLMPLGVPLLGRQSRRGGTPMFGGWFVAAWATVPVRRSTLLRAVYAHGCAWGTLLLVLMLTIPDLEMEKWLFAAVGLAVSASAAATLVCVAAGDRTRGLLCLGAIAAAVAAGIGAVKLGPAAGPPSAFSAPALVVVALAGLAGGVLPLAHLRHRRSVTRRPNEA
jgi:hypothetical protein